MSEASNLTSQADVRRVLKRYLKPDLLILDDIGMKQLPKKSGKFLFEFIMHRHELLSTIMTSNPPMEDWRKLIGDVTAILDRYLQDAEVIQLTGRSYRLRGKSADENLAGSESAEPANKKSKIGQTRKLTIWPRNFAAVITRKLTAGLSLNHFH